MNLFGCRFVFQNMNYFVSLALNSKYFVLFASLKTRICELERLVQDMEELKCRVKDLDEISDSDALSLRRLEEEVGMCGY